MKKPVKFYFTVFSITWVLWFFGVYLSYQPNKEILLAILMIAGLTVPFGTALCLLSKNAAQKKTFFDKLLNMRRIDLSTLPIVIAIMPLTIVLSIFISWIFGYSLDQFQFSKQFSFSAGIVPVILLLVLAPTLEELGWRGYAIESLQSKFNYFTATLIFGILWAFWHFPLFFLKDYYQSNLCSENIWFAVNFMVSAIPVAFIISWLYRKNSESILLAIFFHFIINISQEALQIEQVTKCIQTGVLFGIFSLIVLSNKEMFFAPPDRVAYSGNTISGGTRCNSR